MKEMELNGKSRDIVSDNISKLKELFPDIVCEDKIDFNILKEILGENVDDSKEKYSFTWPGKTQAIRESQKQSTGTLRPSRSDSKNWNTTQNLYIEGDNLEVLKLLQKSYYNKIKAIYIDPPYNTGKDFVYKDDYKDNLENYLKISGQVLDSEDYTHTPYGVKLSSNTESQGRYHTNWLNMMYPRLKLARNLLKDDGVIFISIDDTEVENLRKMCDEIFGVENRLDRGTIIWPNKGSTKGFNKIVKNHEYIIAYAKKSELVESKFGENNPEKMDIIDERLQIKRSKKNPVSSVLFPKGLKIEGVSNIEFKNSIGNGTNRIDIKEGSLNFVDGELIENVVLEASFPYKNQMIEFFSKLGTNEKTYDYKGQEWKEVYFTKTGVPYFRKYRKYKIISSILEDISNSGFNDLKELGLEQYFDNSKPVNLIHTLITFFCAKNDIILDFFSGSATTAQAAFYGNNNNFILVQIPEKTMDDSNAFIAGYKNICEIGKERIRRAGDKIVEESGNKDLDIGFKVFKLDSSNLEKWDPDYNNIQQSLTIDNIKEDRTNEDLVYEIMLKYGIDLTLPIEEHDNIYSIGFGALVICLDNNITKEIANDIIKLTENSSTSRVVFKDSGFKSDADKTNIKEILKTNHIDEFITI